MKRVIMIILALLLVAFVVDAGGFEDLTVKKSETIKKDLAFQGGDRTLEINNIFGAIHLEGYDGKTVKLTTVKTIKAKSKEKLQNAQDEVKLAISIDGGDIVILVDGPFRKKDGRVEWNFKERGYIVQYDFQLKVPRKTSITLKTVSHGDIEVSGIEGKCVLNNVNDKIQVSDLNGDFDIHTVNGGIRVKGVTGSGTAHTVNGKVLVNFVKNPPKDCSFHTINGKLDIGFRPGLSANFKLKTFHGKIYSDFSAAYLPTSPEKGERKDGKFVYKSGGFQGIRIGKGGPTIKMDTLNGNIYIAEGE